MTLSQQYDQQKHETADRYREMDAVDEVLHDIKSLRGSSVDEETLEDLIEQVEDMCTTMSRLNIFCDRSLLTSRHF